MRSHWHILSFALPCTVLLCSSLSVQAQDAKTVLNKMASNYKNAKSYQATIELKMVMQNKPLTSTITFKQAGKKAYSHTVSKGAPGLPKGGQEGTAVDDGVNLYQTVTPTEYLRMAHSDPRSKIFLKSITQMSPTVMTQEMVADKTTTYKMLPASSVEGKPTYVIEANTQGTAAMKIKLFIDKGTYHLKQLKMDSGGPIDMTLSIRNEIFNAAIPAKFFVFTPPKGAKERKNPSGPDPR